ncbi:peptide/nickel transport system ATP-binding protein [Acetitomaculum ruminis DSM 5522]|uniref:Peptide/nickel transport system ATP-binding protein n=1 Tax=Acetitomaculum ruminis DSM 5522 TaxID=1120918 RepID=A0A1I0YTV0_9FIRM|nr:ATP-binding cassette domain-containing protein [Acetitomaculum ruminis]SFB15543.1 peptide/nickel transport system ATP-binding protein [Acetitomaculum ruminis DSM 5522]
MQFKAEHISFRYTDKSPLILEDVSLTIEAGERVGIVGPSGCGKSTFAKIMAGYQKPVKGQILIDDVPMERKVFCPVQMIYQHPELAVNPRWKMKKTLNECFEPDEYLLEQMGIEKAWLNRWPSELSGGELQRFCIARILAPQTKLLICDEITTMLDVITQAQIWKMLLEIADERKMSMAIITHNQALAEKVCTRIVRISD